VTSAGGARRRGFAGPVRLVVALVVALAAVAGAVLLFRHSRSPGSFGPFMADGAMTEVTRYSGPWIMGAGGLLLLAALLLVVVVVDAVRLGRRRRTAA
jgi:hypothetical protein